MLVLHVVYFQPPVRQLSKIFIFQDFSTTLISISKTFEGLGKSRKKTFREVWEPCNTKSSTLPR